MVSKEKKSMCKYLLSAAMTLASAAPVLAQGGWLESRGELERLMGGGVCEDFERFNVADNQIAVTDCRALNCNSTCNGQGPGLVACDNFYSGVTNTIVWLGRGHGGIPTRAIRSGTAFAMTYPTNAQVVGFDLRALLQQGIFVRVTIKDGNLNVVDVREFQDPEPDAIFVGYHHPDGIEEVRLEGLFGTFPVIDDHCFGAAAEPCPEKARIVGKYVDGDDITIKLKKHEPNASYVVQVRDRFDIVVFEDEITVSDKGKAAITILDFNCDSARHAVRNDTCGLQKPVKKDCTG